MRFRVATALTAGLFAAVAQAETPEQYFAIDAFAVSHDERIPDHDITFGGRLGIGGTWFRSGNSSTGFEVGVFTNPIKTDGSSGDKQTGLMLDLMQVYSLGGLEPYLFAGVGFVGERIGPSDGAYPSLEVGAGLLFPVLGDTVLRTGVSMMSVRNDELNAGIDAYVDYRINVGLMFGMTAAAAKEPAPKAAARVADSDGDGLADGQDQCPTTPASTADGCPPPPVARTDADGDGVFDGDDSCPGTLAGLKVDERGCAVQSEEQTVVLKGVTFLPGSATLTPDAKQVLDGAASALAGQQNLKVEIGGHTDSQGKDAANLALSQKRAESVRQYLISQGISGDRLKAEGYGETRPVADNGTLEGRTQNRRVELKVVQ